MTAGRAAPTMVHVKPDSRLEDLVAVDLMTPGVVTIAETASLRQGFRAMTAHHVSAILVVGRSTGRPIGWITDRGLLSKVNEDLGASTVRDAITEGPLSVTPGATARHVTTALSGPGTTRLLVSAGAGSAPEGVIAAADLVRAAGA